MSDPYVRHINICKHGYSAYCARCNYRINAEWCKGEGFEYGTINVTCCANGGKCKGLICPHGIGYDIPIGGKK